MIATAKAFMWLGAVAGALGVLGGLLIVAGFILDWWRRRGTRQVSEPEQHSGLYTTPRCVLDEINRAAAAQNASAHETTLNHSAEFHQ